MMVKPAQYGSEILSQYLHHNDEIRELSVSADTTTNVSNWWTDEQIAAWLFLQHSKWELCQFCDFQNALLCPSQACKRTVCRYNVFFSIIFWVISASVWLDSHRRSPMYSCLESASTWSMRPHSAGARHSNEWSVLIGWRRYWYVITQRNSRWSKLNTVARAQPDTTPAARLWSPSHLARW